MPASGSELFPFLPDTSFEPLSEFWAGTARGELVQPRCQRCNEHSWYPGVACHHCGGDLEWVVVPPEGEVHAATRVHHAFHPALAPLVPFRVALVTLSAAPAVRLVLRVLGDGPVPAPGAPVKVEFLAVDDGLTLPVAQLTDEEAPS